jgi:hypothetical protein
LLLAVRTNACHDRYEDAIVFRVNGAECTVNSQIASVGLSLSEYLRY